jgi:hypothetical protein
MWMRITSAGLFLGVVLLNTGCSACHSCGSKPPVVASSSPCCNGPVGPVAPVAAVGPPPTAGGQVYFPPPTH